MQLVLTQGCGRDPQPCPMRFLGGPCCWGLLGQHERTTTLNPARPGCVGTASFHCPAVAVLLTLTFNCPLGKSRGAQMRTTQVINMLFLNLWFAALLAAADREEQNPELRSTSEVPYPAASHACATAYPSLWSCLLQGTAPFRALECRSKKAEFIQSCPTSGTGTGRGIVY